MNDHTRQAGSLLRSSRARASPPPHNIVAMLDHLDTAFQPQRVRSAGVTSCVDTSKGAPHFSAPTVAATPPLATFASSSPRSLALSTSGRGAETGALLPSPRFVLPSSSSSTSSFEAALTARPPKLKRRVTFSPTPLASLQASPKHKRRYCSPLGVGRGLAGDEENAGMGGAFARERKRPRLARNVYSDNPLFEATRSADRFGADEDTPSSGSDVAAGGDSSDPALSSSPARSAPLVHPPTRPVANRSFQVLRSPPRPPQLAVVDVRPKRTASRADDDLLPFRLPGLVIVEQPQEEPEDADAEGTDSEAESEVVSSLLLPTAAALPANPSPALSSDAHSSSSPLRSPSQRLRPPTSLKISPGAAILPLKPILKPFPQPLPSTLAKDERDGQRKNGRGRRHAVGWESEKRAKEKAQEVRERRKQMSESRKRKREDVDAGEGTGGKGTQRATASTSAATGSTAGGTKSRGRVTRAGKSGGGSGGGRDGDDDQRRRKRVPSGSGDGGAGAPSQTPSPGLDGVGTKRFTYAIAADDPVLLTTPLLTLRSSLRHNDAAAYDSAYEGAAPALPPRPHPNVPDLVADEAIAGLPALPRPPPLLNDVEDAYVALKNAFFQLPATFDAAVTLAPLRTHASTLLSALTRDIGNITTFPAWVKSQPSPQSAADGLSSPFPPASEDPVPSSPGQPAPSSASSNNGAARTSLTESQMRRMRDEVAVAQAAIKCAAALLKDERLFEAFEGEYPLSSSLRLVLTSRSRRRVARLPRLPRRIDSPCDRPPRHGSARPLPLRPFPHPVPAVVAGAHSASPCPGHPPRPRRDALDGTQDRSLPLRLLRVARSTRQASSHQRRRPSRRRRSWHLASARHGGPVGGLEEGHEHAGEDDAGARQSCASAYNAAGRRGGLGGCKRDAERCRS